MSAAERFIKRCEMGKTSFVIRKSWIPLFLGLSTMQAGELIQSVMSYENGVEKAPSDQTLCAVYEAIKAQLDEDTAKYEEVCKQRASAGRKGGLAKASNRKQVVANDSKGKQSLPDSDSENESDTDIEIESEREREKEKARQKAKENHGGNPGGKRRLGVIPVLSKVEMERYKAAGG